jgi:UDP-2-acetamido-2,6-beta-L-arabino-hexul-4-ose reductase
VANTLKPRNELTRVLITGADGFLGKNLRLHLSERPDVDVVAFTRENNLAQLPALLRGVDLVFHLAGVNRPKDSAEFQVGNRDLTIQLIDAVVQVMRETGQRIPVVFASSTQASLSNPYGDSKREAEQAIFSMTREYGLPAYVFRLPNVFGKWCRPNYNSVVATYCHNIARGLPIQINDAAAPLALVYVDDVVERFMQLINTEMHAPVVGEFSEVFPIYQTTVGAVAEQLNAFARSRDSLLTERVGCGLTRALYSTYVSYLPTDSFAYPVPQHKDPRGVFVEMLKTPDAGQFSFFTAHPGVTRGGHYHHSKTEKFLVIKGQARFRFRHMQTNQVHELGTSGERSEIVETVPGWTHDITNVGNEEMIVMLWANEVFDRQRPDTYDCPVLDSPKAS